MDKKECFDVRPSTVYTAIVFVRNNTMTEPIQFKINNNNNGIFEGAYAFTNLRSGINKIKLTSKADFSSATNGQVMALLSTNIEGSVEIKYVLLEGDWTNKPTPIDKPIEYGTYSTKAIITNNDKKYYFYANEEDKQQGKVIELPFKEDAIVINEDGTGTWINASEKIDLSMMFTPTGFAKTSTVGTNTTRWYFTKMFRGTIMNGLADFNGWTNSLNSLDEPCIGTIANSYIQVRMPNSITTSQEVYQYLKENNMMGKCILNFGKNKVETTIPKELTSIILTYEKNTFSFGEEVKPSKASITLPVQNMLSVLEAQMEAKLCIVDTILSDHDLSIVDLYEMALINELSIQRLATTRSIADSYVRLIIKGTRTFESVPYQIKEDVASILIQMGREDLVTEYKA